MVLGQNKLSIVLVKDSIRSVDMKFTVRKVHFACLWIFNLFSQIVQLISRNFRSLFIENSPLFNLARASFLVYVFVSLARCLAGYEILAFEKPCLHYHIISTESRLIYTGSKWKRTNRKHATIYRIFSRKVRT